jgi:hypothetical protein
VIWAIGVWFRLLPHLHKVQLFTAFFPRQNILGIENYGLHINPSNIIFVLPHFLHVALGTSSFTPSQSDIFMVSSALTNLPHLMQTGINVAPWKIGLEFTAYLVAGAGYLYVMCARIIRRNIKLKKVITHVK